MAKDKPTEPDAPATTAIEAEATGAKTLIARWNDRDWIVPASLDMWDADALEAYGDLVDGGRAGESDLVTFRHSARMARGVLGKQQWQRWKNGGSTTAGDLSGLVKAIFAAYDEATSGE